MVYTRYTTHLWSFQGWVFYWVYHIIWSELFQLLRVSTSSSHWPICCPDASSVLLCSFPQIFIRLREGTRKHGWLGWEMTWKMEVSYTWKIIDVHSKLPVNLLWLPKGTYCVGCLSLHAADATVASRLASFWETIGLFWSQPIMINWLHQ